MNLGTRTNKLISWWYIYFMYLLTIWYWNANTIYFYKAWYLHMNVSYAHPNLSHIVALKANTWNIHVCCNIYLHIMVLWFNLNVWLLNEGVFKDPVCNFEKWFVSTTELLISTPGEESYLYILPLKRVESQWIRPEILM